MRELLQVLAATKPLVLALDDLHWADQARASSSARCCDDRRPRAVLLAFAVRPRQLREQLFHRPRAGAPRRGAGPDRARRPDADEARELLGDAVDDAAAGALHAESGGNPFYLEQLARTVRRAVPGEATARTSCSATSRSRGRGRRPARGARAAVGGARGVLEGAAVAGDPFEIELAAAGAQSPRRRRSWRSTSCSPGPRPRRRRSPGGSGSATRSCGARSTRPRPAACGSGARAVRGGARGARRLGAARAHHVERSARAGDAAAVALLREAGRAAWQRAPASAARWFAGALRLLPANAGAQERVE